MQSPESRPVAISSRSSSHSFWVETGLKEEVDSKYIVDAMVILTNLVCMSQTSCTLCPQAQGTSAVWLVYWDPLHKAPAHSVTEDANVVSQHNSLCFIYNGPLCSLSVHHITETKGYLKRLEVDRVMLAIDLNR